MTVINPKKVSFTIDLFNVNAQTESGNIYPAETLMAVVDQINTTKPKLTVQEMNVPERQAKSIPLWEPIKKNTMAVLDSAEIVDGVLKVQCETRLTRDGKKLAGMLSNLESSEMTFFPVGYGDGANGNKHIITSYELKYIALEPNNTIK
jgi:hypothetical protein